ncbi:MAG: molybdopterin-guanine dinucleotide biosynthesis protein B [Syntrophomonadaceae bacterium]|jgi:molybdopterin-guanine dinucleotide biosynthesis protein B
MVPIVSFVGRHNSGKTSILTRVIAYLKQQGIKTAIIKHAAHGLSIQPVTDSDRLFSAGATTVYVASPDVAIHYSRYDQQKSLHDLYEKVAEGVDLVITEGYKQEATKKIEVLRREISTKPLRLENLIARVCDFHLDHQVPEFAFEQHQEIAEFLIETLQLRKTSTKDSTQIGTELETER